MEKEFELYDFFKSPKTIKDEAKEALIGNKKSSLAINFIFTLSKLSFFTGLVLLILLIVNIATYNIILFSTLSLSFLLISLLTYGPLRVSVCKNALNMVNNTNPSFKDVAFGFKNKYGRNVGYGISLFFVYLINLILLIIPFLKKYCDYQVSGFILAEDLEVSSGDALKLSSKLSKGYTKNYLKIIVTLLPQFALCIPTLLIYSLWLKPLYNSMICVYYYDIKA